MRIQELDESFSQIWARNKSGPVRRYKCTNGPKTGRVVAKPATCNAASTRPVFGIKKPSRRKTTSRPNSSFIMKQPKVFKRKRTR